MKNLLLPVHAVRKGCFGVLSVSSLLLYAVMQSCLHAVRQGCFCMLLEKASFACCQERLLLHAVSCMSSGNPAFACCQLLHAFSCMLSNQKRLLLHAVRQGCFCMLSEKAAFAWCEKVCLCMLLSKAAFAFCQKCIISEKAMLSKVQQNNHCFCILSEKAAFACCLLFAVTEGYFLSYVCFACCQERLLLHAVRKGCFCMAMDGIGCCQTRLLLHAFACCLLYVFRKGCLCMLSEKAAFGCYQKRLLLDDVRQGCFCIISEIQQKSLHLHAVWQGCF